MFCRGVPLLTVQTVNVERVAHTCILKSVHAELIQRVTGCVYIQWVEIHLAQLA